MTTRPSRCALRAMIFSDKDARIIEVEVLLDRVPVVRLEIQRFDERDLAAPRPAARPELDAVLAADARDDSEGT